jgi:glutathione S-transferase
MSSQPITTPSYVFYAAERSYFSGKVRPALRAKRLYFEEHLPTPDAYRDIRRRTGLTFIPVVVTPEDETWQDTSDILDALEARVPEPALVPPTPVQRVVSSLLELYADEFMILPAMHYRWSRPEGVRDARGAFAALSGDAERAGRFADQMAGSLPALGVTEANGPAIEAHLAELLESMETVLTAQSFLLGEQLSVGDCAMMGPFYAHLYLDLGPGQLLLATAPRVCHWIERCNHPAPGSFTGFRADDSLHPSMHDILRLIGTDAVPLLLDTLRDFERWIDEQASNLEELPRAVGFHSTHLRDVEFQRYTSCYTPWMAQRVLDTYQALAASDRERVDSTLAGTGCDALLQWKPRSRVGKRNFKLVVERS